MWVCSLGTVLSVLVEHWAIIINVFVLPYHPLQFLNYCHCRSNPRLYYQVSPLLVQPTLRTVLGSNKMENDYFYLGTKHQDIALKLWWGKHKLVVSFICLCKSWIPVRHATYKLRSFKIKVMLGSQPLRIRCSCFWLH